MELTKNYYISIDLSGNNKGLFPPNLLTIDEIKERISNDDFLIQISEDFYNTFLQNSKKLTDLPRPKFRADKVLQLLEEQISDWTNEELIEKFTMYCETIELPTYKKTITQEQEDIKALTEILMGILGPVAIPETDEASPLLEKLREIAGRYK